jgi:hypothetical protein
VNTHNYSIKKYPFRELVENALGHDDLEKLHTQYIYEPFTMENNSNTELHDRFYNKLRAGWKDFTETYDRFIEEVVIPIYGSRDFIYQSLPTFRVHLVGNWTVPEFHHDSQPGYNHPAGEINFQIAITDMFGTNATWCETVPGLGDFAPMEMNQGEFTIFNGNTCDHGNMINDSEQTRVSFDFRILPLKKYNPSTAKTSATRGTSFTVGGYYKELR